MSALPRPAEDWATGLKHGLLLGAAVLVVLLPLEHRHLAAQRVALATPHRVAAAPAAAVQPTIERRLDFGNQLPTADVRALAAWVVEQGDNGVKSFAVLDKKDARVYVFEPSGKLKAATPVLLGYARGDDTVEGIGQRPIADVKPEERTTPAGRFVAQPGRNALHEDVLWVDYDAAVSMHRVRLTNPSERRLERLSSNDAHQRRISYGCINMPVRFFEDVLWPTMGRKNGGVVYVLPEVKPLTAVFPQLASAVLTTSKPNPLHT
jgi:hypothetical protein